MELPDLKHNYNDASIEDVKFGPRRELTLKVYTVVWNGNKGQYQNEVTIRFGGILNLAAVKEFFDLSPHLNSELASISFDKNQKSKPNHMYINLTFERIDAQIVIECSNLLIT